MTTIWNSTRQNALHFLFSLAGALMILMSAGCDSGESYYDHVPPPGRGSLIIDNNTGDDISVYIDGALMTGVGDGSTEIVDLTPGFFRLVLDADNAERSYRADIDILEDRLTVLEVRSSSANNYYDYDVITTFY